MIWDITRLEELHHQWLQRSGRSEPAIIIESILERTTCIQKALAKWIDQPTISIMPSEVLKWEMPHIREEVHLLQGDINDADRFLSSVRSQSGKHVLPEDAVALVPVMLGYVKEVKCDVTCWVANTRSAGIMDPAVEVIDSIFRETTSIQSILLHLIGSNPAYADLTAALRYSLPLVAGSAQELEKIIKLGV